MKKVLKIISILIIGFIFYYFLFPHRMYFNTQSIKTVRLLDGTTGKAVYIQDEKVINDLINRIHKIIWRKRGSTKGRSGYSYSILFFNSDGDEVKKIVVYTNDLISYKKTFYNLSITGNSDTDYLDQFIIDFNSN